MFAAILVSSLSFVVLANEIPCPSEYRNIGYFCRCANYDVTSTFSMACNINTMEKLRALSNVTIIYDDQPSTLLLGFANITELPSSIFHFDHIDTLVIRGRSLTSIDKYALSSLDKSIRSLYLIETSLPEVPLAAFERFLELNLLYMRGNFFNSLQPSLATTQLEHLSAPNDRISIITTGLFPPSLVILELNDNKITSLNGAFTKNLANLLLLDIRNNSIASLHGQLEGTPSLQTLDASKNRISIIDDNSLDFVPKLTNLTLAFNNIREIDTALNALTNLKFLDLCDNRIDMLSNRAFRNCTSLETLYLDRNMIVYTPDNLFDCVTSLRVLKISHNLITHLNFLAPHSTTVEQVQETSEGFMTNICNFRENTSLQVLEMTHNNVVCTEKVYEIIQYLESKAIGVHGDPCKQRDRNK